MLYFCCCEATTPEGVRTKADCYVEFTGRISKVSELIEIQAMVRQKIRRELHETAPVMNWNNANIVFLAFNPL